jgi:hypothetical protein
VENRNILLVINVHKSLGAMLDPESGLTRSAETDGVMGFAANC